ncbi:hypothetical protein LJC56_06550, partial [Christensenellaceae bacterium OttesenSCG-928-K19]|nr:hypothetical protein [Christensenellaceae bacterium OttesenSCG-928-K19]
FKAQSIRTFFSSGQGANKLMYCPNCGKSGYMEFEHDKDYNPADNETANEQSEDNNGTSNHSENN